MQGTPLRLQDCRSIQCSGDSGMRHGGIQACTLCALLCVRTTAIVLFSRCCCPIGVADRRWRPLHGAQMETNKRYEFLQSMVTAVDAHLRYFERGYQLFAGLEPYLQHALQASCLLLAWRGTLTGSALHACRGLPFAPNKMQDVLSRDS